MALVRPICPSIASFDATRAYTFTFTSTGGSQVVKNKLLIKNNLTNVIVYDTIKETFRFEQTLPANTLVNGESYVYTFVTYDIDNNESPQGNWVPFKCFSTAIVEFTNLPVGNIINSSNFTFNGRYSQAESELMDFAVFNLYDSTGSLISTSGNIYNTSTPPIELTHEFNGFSSATTYKISLSGTTVNGATFTTGLIDIYVNYIRPELFSIVQLTNNCKGGYVEIKNNMVLIEGESNPDPPIYIDDEKVDVTGDGHWVQWVKGYNITGDFTCQMWFEAPNIGENKPLITLWNNSNVNGNNRITVNLRQEKPYGETEIKTFAELRCSNGLSSSYYIMSDYIDNPLPDDKFTIWFRRINNIFSIRLEVL